MDGLRLLRLANFIPNFTLDNGVVVTLRDVGDYKVVTVEAAGALPVHVPAVVAGAGVGVRGAAELQRVALLRLLARPRAARGQLHPRRVADTQQQRHLQQVMK